MASFAVAPGVVGSTASTQAGHAGLATLAIVAAVVLVTALSSAAAAEAPGDASRGQAIFAAKHCAQCHRPRAERGTGPPLEEVRRPQGAYALAGRLWNHAPAMFTVLTQERLEWPRISAEEMTDLMAYLQADPRRDPPPDLIKGLRGLISKGCLKCHSFRAEGGRVGPDLADRDASYASAAAWASTMWSHTPRMAAVAIQRGIVYPRFSADEMLNLVAFLRSGGNAP